MFKIDTLFSTPRAAVAPFQFDAKVAEVFPDMITRSVPGYGDILAGLSLITARFAQDNTHIYDLGCSLGAATLALEQGLKHTHGCTLIGVDNSQAMLTKAAKVFEHLKLSRTITLAHADINQVLLENASVVVLNFTLQFIPHTQRLALVKKIYDSLTTGGVLIVSDKFAYTNTEHQKILTELHLDFKQKQGYSALEISQKRTALENILVADTLDAHQERLTQAGFKQVLPWHQVLNFGSLLAIK